MEPGMHKDTENLLDFSEHETTKAGIQRKARCWIVMVLLCVLTLITVAGFSGFEISRLLMEDNDSDIKPTILIQVGYGSQLGNSDTDSYDYDYLSQASEHAGDADKEHLNTQCSVPNPDKKDCYPEGGPSQGACEARGCCWVPSYAPNKNVPWCYYSFTPGTGYTLRSQSTTELGLSLQLIRSEPSGWPADVTTLQVDVKLETQSRLHFKVFDPNSKRYEVPLSTPVVASRPAVTDYELVVSGVGDDFGLQVVRKSTGRVLFDSTGMQLIFADQVLRMTTKLPSTNVFGLGERSGRLRCDASQAQRYTMWTRDQPPVENCNLYGSHPFFMGLDVDGSAYGVFLLNSNAMDVDITPGSLPLLTYTTIGGVLDFYIFTGPTPDSVVQQYTEVIGRPFFPPYWALGFHLCRWGYGNLQGMQAVINRTRAGGFPYDVQWNDIEYMNAHMDWTLDNGSFSGLSSVVDNLHANDQHYIIIVDPAISTTPGYRPYDEGMAAKLFVMSADGSSPIVGNVWPGDTVYPDFSNPGTNDWWAEQVQAFHNQLSFDGLWVDMNEPSNFGYGSINGCPGNSPLDSPPFVPAVCGGRLADKTLCPSAVQNLSTFYNLHSLYGHSELVATYSALQTIQNGKRGFVLSRSTFAGSGKYGGHWLGDNTARWSYLQDSIAGIITFNMFGVPLIGADICGFFGDTTEELCVRWMQLGAFYPFMRNHNSIGQKDQDPGAPWFSAAAKDAMRSALLQRYTLLPYLYTLHYLAHVNGSAVVRPLFFQYPGDASTYDNDMQFLWGDALMIAPVLVPGATEISVYFPNDTWYDFASGSLVKGEGATESVLVTMDRIPVYQRGGSILPAQQPSVTTAQSRQNPFSLIVALDTNGNAFGSLYWDDGESLNLTDTGSFNWITFQVTQSTLTVRVQTAGYPTAMNLGSVILRGVTKFPTSASVNGMPVDIIATQQGVMLELGSSVQLLTPLTVSWQ